MKIFAYNLCLDFSVKNSSQNFDFSPISYEAFLIQLQEGLYFPGQVIYLSANANKDFLDNLFVFQTEDRYRNLYLTLSLVFEEDAIRQKALNKFCKRFRDKVAAGGIVINDKEEYLCIFGRGRWSFAKGGVKREEDIQTAAIREVQEETGLVTVKVLGKCPSTFHTFIRKGKWAIKETHWYKMFAPGEQVILPQEEEGITDVKWISKSTWIEQKPPTYPLITELMEREFANFP